MVDEYIWFVTQQLDSGMTVHPELGVYVSVNEATGQCHVSYELETDDDVSEACFLRLYC